MTHQQKLDFMFADLSQRGIKKGTMAPPLYLLLWKLGVPITPPHFASFVGNALFMSTFFALFYGVLMWFIWWQHHFVPAERAAVDSLCTGILFGLLMAAYYAWQARKHSLPRWKDYSPRPRTTI